MYQEVGSLFTIISILLYFKAQGLEDRPELRSIIKSISINLAFAGGAFAIISIISEF